MAPSLFRFAPLSLARCNGRGTGEGPYKNTGPFNKKHGAMLVHDPVLVRYRVVAYCSTPVWIEPLAKPSKISSMRLVTSWVTTDVALCAGA